MSASAPSPSAWSEEESANVEKVKTAIDAFNRRDVEALTALGNAADFEYDWSRSMAPNRGVYRGLEGFLEFVHDQWSMFDEVRSEPHEFIPRGPHVVVPTTTHGRGRDGIAVTARSAQLYTFEEGRLVRVALYKGREEALAAAK